MSSEKGFYLRIDELTRFVLTPIRSQLAQIDRRIADKAEGLRQTYAARRRLQILSAEITKRSLEEALLPRSL